VTALDEGSGETLCFEGKYVFSTMPVDELIPAMGDAAPADVQRVAKRLTDEENVNERGIDMWTDVGVSMTVSAMPFRISFVQPSLSAKADSARSIVASNAPALRPLNLNPVPVPFSGFHSSMVSSSPPVARTTGTVPYLSE